MALERLVGHFGAVVNARYRGKVELTFSRKGGHGVMRISGMPAADRKHIGDEQSVAGHGAGRVAAQGSLSQTSGVDGSLGMAAAKPCEMAM